MRKRRLIILTAVFVAALCGLVWWAATPRRPALSDLVYDGQPLSYWLDHWSWNPDGSAYINGLEAPRGGLDSNAVPFLIQALKKHDGRLRRAYNRLWYRLPGWLQRDVPPPKAAWLVRTEADRLLGQADVTARPAIPDLIRVLREDDDQGPRAYAAEALGNIANSRDKSVVEALVVAINDPGANVRRLAREALKRIDPDTAAQVGVQ